jgi:hypothetical protein
LADDVLAIEFSSLHDTSGRKSALSGETCRSLRLAQVKGSTR